MRVGHFMQQGYALSALLKLLNFQSSHMLLWRRHERIPLGVAKMNDHRGAKSPLSVARATYVEFFSGKTIDDRNHKQIFFLFLFQTKRFQNQ